MSHRTRIPLLVLGVSAAVSLGAGGAGAYTEATATASAGQYSLLCSTCSIDYTSLGQVADGGAGAASAHADLTGSGYSGIADVAFGGPDALPDLGAYAFADELFDGTRTYLYQAGATAVGVQTYAYGGALPATYTISYTIDGTFFLNANDAASLMQVYGGVTVYGPGYVPRAEVNPVLDYDYSGANASVAGSDPFLLSGAVTFTVNPGDVFTVSATLFASANASHQVTGSADALHTLDLQFAGGDTSLLTPELASVPEPSSAALVGLGLAAGALRARVRRRPDASPSPRPA